MSNIRVPFNKPYFTGQETKYIQNAVAYGKISGNGYFTKKCQTFFEENYGIKKALLTSSCTDALEMAALLLNIVPGDEVIIPSFTFVSTANAFVLRGAKIVYCDSKSDHPGIDEFQIEELITPKTKAIVPVHYAGVACDMEKIMQIAVKHGLYVVEDAAQAIDSYFTFSDGTKKALGSIGHLATFSFHETKNIISGEGGLLAINETKFIDRAEIIWEKGTNRSAFFKGDVEKYEWVDLGSSFQPSEIIAAILYAQIEELPNIQRRRQSIWMNYNDLFKNEKLNLPYIPTFAEFNYHIFYLICESTEQRKMIIENLKLKGILAVFHYQSLHKSPFAKSLQNNSKLKNAERYSNLLLRLPLYYELKKEDQNEIHEIISNSLS